MIDSPPAARRAPTPSLVFFFSLGLLTCKAKEREFYDKVFTCEHGAAQDSCGTTESGGPMVCVSAKPLGGEDFCAPKCDPAIPVSDERFRCLASRALVQVCHPFKNRDQARSGCPLGLECYRTNLLDDVGICVNMRTCAKDEDCAGDLRHRVCGATELKKVTGKFPFQLDHMQCVQSMCNSSGSSCASGEGCLSSYYEIGPVVPDICVPFCDSENQCPPNFGCATSAALPGSPPICVPGIPGVRCSNDQDCLLGQCAMTDAGFGVCVLAFDCTSDDQCGGLNGPTLTFVCGDTARGRRCVGTSPFNGSNCTKNEDCDPRYRCFQYDPYAAQPIHGECRLACDTDGARCPSRAGIPHVCLGTGRGCYPGGFAMPCKDSSECIAGLQCTTVTPDIRTRIDSPTICTMPCNTDEDCQANPWVRTGGFCKEGLCRMTGRKGDPCERDGQCVNLSPHVCNLNGDGAGSCLN